MSVFHYVLACIMTCNFIFPAVNTVDIPMHMVIQKQGQIGK